MNSENEYKNTSRLQIYDCETYKDLFCCSFIDYKSSAINVFVIDKTTNDRDKLIKFIKNKLLVGYNNKTFDDIIINAILKHDNLTSQDLHRLATKIIEGQRKDNFNLYTEFRAYLKSNKYESIDLMRLLFSKKLRVSLKELECSLHHYNVQELPIPIDTEKLTPEEKELIIEYNKNDIIATKLVLEKSMEQLKLRKWIKNTYHIDTFSVDPVNGGIKILEALYEKQVGNRDFKELRSVRNKIYIKDCILSLVKFETKEFNDVLERYKKHIWYNHDYNEYRYVDNSFNIEPVINGVGFKFALGGLHTNNQARIWESTDTHEIISIDISSYYPRQIIEHGFVPEHLNKQAFLDVYKQVMDERLDAKAHGQTTKDTALKLAINGTYGMLGNQYSWMFDHNVRLQICVNGQLMLAMLIERIFKEGIQLIEANTDGLFLYVNKKQKAKLNSLVKEWESETKMLMEETKFEKIWFLNTADYFGTYYKKGKLEIKEKGLFLSEVQLGKGMEFPIIAKAVKSYFLESANYTNFVLDHTDILDFCSYKKLKRQFECFHHEKPQQRINRFYAIKSGAYLYKRKFDEKKQRFQTDHVLKDSPVEIYNKFNDMPMKERNLNYAFYLSKIREIINSIEGDKNQLTLF